MSEEMAIVEELHDINRKLTAGIQVATYREMRVINRAANAITRLTDENAALTSNRAMLNAEATRLTNTIIERNKKIDLRGDNIAKLLVERDTLEAEVKFLVEEEKCTESEFEKMEDEYAVIIRELREQLREARDKGSDG